MSRYTRKAILFFCCMTLLLAGLTGRANDSARLPDALLKKLQEFQRADNLADWIYARLDHVDSDPANNLDFLMATQQAAWRSYYTYPEREAWFNLLLLQGYHQLQAGNILASINAYEAAVQFYESYPLPLANPDEYLDYVLKPLGNNYTRLADYNTALYIQQKALALAEKKNNRQETAAIYSNMATSARWKGDLAGAVRYCQSGIRLVNRKSSLYGLLLSTYADVMMEQQRYDTAALLCRQALDWLDAFHQLGPMEDATALWYAGALQLEVRLALQKNNMQRAEGRTAFALSVLEEYFPATRQREKAKVNVLSGEILGKMHRYKESLEAHHQALRLLMPNWLPGNIRQLPPDSVLYGENTLADALAGKAEALAALQDVDAALAHYLAVFRAARQLRREFYSTDAKIRDLQVLRERATAAMQLAWQEWERTRQPRYQQQLLLIAELSKAQVLMEERVARLKTGTIPMTDTLALRQYRLREAVVTYQHELATGNAPAKWRNLLQATEYELSLLNKKIRLTAAAGLPEPALPDAGLLQTWYSLLPADVIVLEFFEGQPYSYLMELDRNGLRSTVRLPGRDSLRQLIPPFLQRWFTQGAAAMLNEPQEYYRDAHAIYDLLFGHTQWQPGRRYMLIPDGVFNYLPFDALVTEPAYKADVRQWPFLFRKAIVSQAYALQTWYSQQTQPYLEGQLAAFFVSRGKGSTQPVLSVEKEYALLKDRIGAGHAYFNEKATWQAFRQLADSLTVLHIGTHAVSSSLDSFPYLQLYDRPFLLADLRYKRFAPSLVVLGACRTADGLLMEGEGVNSLSRGFTAAGAGGVVSGLWNVNDEAATEIMALFYKALEAGDDPALALHRSREQWLEAHAGNPQLQLPYYWAGLQYSGHLLPVYFGEKGLRRYYWWLTAAGGLLLAGARWRYKKRSEKARRSTG
ncbi:MAG: CHAT domain-containing protein [Candidatus Pseudobacter hemicellulosilyticus]|uniref:CHAT domain-containing protein n=1 Tax=Candidatus Pseudobacter hemicellulosilyticus TaxID=3121375 RepID=A0AAJ6BFF2_9BACT|nr:MAG: CHAT domain-containing protein [Pseudobacter sp.]